MSLQPLLITTAVEALFSLALGAVSAYTVSNGHDTLQVLPQGVDPAFIVRASPPPGLVRRWDDAKVLNPQLTLEVLGLPLMTKQDVHDLAAAVTVVCAVRLILELILIVAVATLRRMRKKVAAKNSLLVLCVFVTAILPLFIFINVARFAVAHQAGWDLAHPLRITLIVLFALAAVASIGNVVITWAVRRLDNDRPESSVGADAKENQKGVVRMESFRTARSSMSLKKGDAADGYESDAGVESLRGWSQPEYGQSHSRQTTMSTTNQWQQQQQQQAEAAPTETSEQHQQQQRPSSSTPSQRAHQAHLAAARSHLLRTNSLGLAYVPPDDSTAYTSPSASPPAVQQLLMPMPSLRSRDEQARFEFLHNVARMYAPM